MNNEKCFPFFFDWIEPFSELSGEEFKKLVLAMLRYYKYGRKPPRFEGTTKTIALFVFAQLNRTKKNRENGKKGGNPKLKKSKNGSTDDLSDALNTTTSTTTPTTTNTTTSTSTSTTNENHFEIFWEKYPKKMNRTNAFEEFIKLNLSNEEFEYMLSQLEKHKKSKQWRDTQYIPLPENYIKLKKWTDELEMDDSSFDTDEFFQSALERSRKHIKEVLKRAE
ncbi:MAG: hypothetical protein IJW54_04285 [Clostridia bacterium]|nr:hypothetical protein [Clostridia bacterium]